MLKDSKLFFAQCRDAKGIGQGILGPTLDQNEVNGCNAILSAMEGSPASETAYALATAYHETAGTLQPIKEIGGDRYFTRMYDVMGLRPITAKKHGNVKPGDGPKYAGRGYVQLTWYNNYKLAGEKIGVDLVNNPNLAMQPDIAAKILRKGMDEGWFTGKKFKDYIPAKPSREDYIKARRIINGNDKAELIAGYAMKFYDALLVGGWK